MIHFSCMYTKNFDAWNTKKKNTEKKERILYIKEREIWWCTLGVNIGKEIDGKHDIFERPVLVIKVLSKETFFVLPLSTKGTISRDHFRIVTEKMQSYVKLSQAKIVSCKRFSRKVDTVSKKTFEEIKASFIDYIS